MSWLVESMQTARDFRDKKENDGQERTRDVGKSNIRAYRKGYDDYNAVDKAMSHKYGHDWKDREDDQRMRINADANNAKNAADRHNRRHPDVQVESYMIAELFS